MGVREKGILTGRWIRESPGINVAKLVHKGGQGL